MMMPKYAKCGNKVWLALVATKLVENVCIEGNTKESTVSKTLNFKH